jgi:glycosyltransferase involved in cell wall biosynthesis
MKILHLIPSLSPLRGGPSEAALGMCRALLAEGVEVEIATTDDNGPGHLDVAIGDLNIYEGVPVRFFPRKDYPWRRFTEYQSSPELMAWLKGAIDSYDLLHFHAIFSAIPSGGMALARKAGKPYIARPLGQLCRWSMEQSRMTKCAYMNFGERKKLESAAMLHFTSEMEKRESAAWIRWRDAMVLPHGIEELHPDCVAGAALREGLGIPETAAVGLFLGRIHHKKRLDLLLEIWRSFPQSHHLIVAGEMDPTTKPGIDALMQNHPNRPQIHFLGNLDQTGKEAAWAAADLFLLPSESENFGIAVLEAMAAGLPLILSPHQPLAKVVEEEGLGQVCPLGTQNWLESVRQMFEDPQALVAMGKRARECARREYSWPAQARRLIDIYRTLIE